MLLFNDRSKSYPAEGVYLRTIRNRSIFSQKSLKVSSKVCYVCRSGALLAASRFWGGIFCELCVCVCVCVCVWERERERERER